MVGLGGFSLLLRGLSPLPLAMEDIKVSTCCVEACSTASQALLADVQWRQPAWEP